MIRKTLSVSALVAAILLATGCGSMRRLGKDAFVTAVSPALILYGAATDGWDDSHQFWTNYQPDHRERMPVPQVPMVPLPTTHKVPIDIVNWPMAVMSFPATFIFNAFKHTYYCFRHAVDIFFFPGYLLADIHPAGPPIEPLDLYTGTLFDRPRESKGPEN